MKSKKNIINVYSIKKVSMCEKNQKKLKFHRLFNCIIAANHAWHIKLFKNQRKRGIPAAHTLDGGFQVQETVLHHCRGNLGTNTTRLGCFVCNHETSRLSDRLDNRINIPRQNRTKINQLTAQSRHSLFSKLDRILECIHLGAIAYNRHICAALNHLCFTNG